MTDVFDDIIDDGDILAIQGFVDVQDWAGAYSYVSQTVESAIDPDTGLPLIDVNAQVAQSQLWFEGATEVNQDQGIFSDFIRTYTTIQGGFRHPDLFSKAELDDASNAVAASVLQAILNTGALPTIEDIAVRDADQIRVELFPEFPIPGKNPVEARGPL